MVSGDIQWIWSPSYERVLFELPVAKSCRVWINQTTVYYKTLSVYYKTLSDQWFIRRRSLDCIIFQKVDVGDGCWGPFVSVTSLRLSEIASTSLSPVIYDFKSNLIQMWTIFPDQHNDVKLAYLIRWRHFLVTECSLKHYRHHKSEARPIIEPNHQNVLLNDIDFGGKRTLKTSKLPKNNISDSKADEDSNWLSFYEIILNWYFEFFHSSSRMLLSNQSMMR